MAEMDTSALFMGPIARAAENADLSGIIASIVGEGVLDAAALAELTRTVVSSTAMAKMAGQLARDEFLKAEDDRSRAGRKKFRLRGLTDQNALSMLNSMFGDEYDLIATGGAVLIPHAAAKFSRTLCWDAMVTILSADRSSRTLLVGENAEFAIAHAGGINITRILAPDMSTRDEATRHRLSIPARMNRAIQLGEITLESIAEYERLLSRATYQEDATEVDTICLREVYDISLTDLCDGANKRHAKRILYSLVVPDGLMTDIHAKKKEFEEIPIPELGAYYRILYDRGVPSRIAFSMGQYTMGYEHDLLTYLSLVRETVIHTEHGNWVASCIKSYGPVKIFSVDFVGQVVVEEHRVVEVVDAPSTTTVQTFEYVAGPRDSESSYKPVLISVPTVDFYRLCNHLAAESKQDVTERVQYGVRILRALQKSVTFFTESQRVANRTSADELIPLVVAACIYTARYTAHMKAVVKEELQHIAWRRELAKHTFWQAHPYSYASIAGATLGLSVSMIYSAVKSIPILSQITSVLDLTYLEKVIDKLFSSDRFETTIMVQKALRFIDEGFQGSLASLAVNVPREVKGAYEPKLPTHDERFEVYTPSERTAVETSSTIELPEVDEMAMKRQWAGEAIHEFIRTLRADEQDVDAAIVEASLNIFPGNQPDRRAVERSWSSAAATQANYRVAVLRDGRVVEIIPDREEDRAMYWAPVDTYRDQNTWLVDADIRKGSVVPVDVRTQYLISSDRLAIYNSPRLLRASKLFEGFRSMDVKFELVQGVFGAGKTFDMVQRVKPGDVILTQSKKNQVELLERIQKRFPDFPDSNVRTIDSYLLNPKVRSNTLYIDEGFMMHAGQLLLAMFYVFGATANVAGVVVIYGDKPQIPWINRSNLTGISYSQMSLDFFDSNEFRDTSLRCSAQAVLMFADCYDVPIYTTSEVVRSKAWKTIKTLEDVPVLPDTQYITYTRITKFRLMEFLRAKGLKVVGKARDELPEGGVRVNVQGELQGATSAAVITVRDSVEAQALIDKQPFQLVDGSRETHAHLYCTVLGSSNADSSLKRFMQRFSDIDLARVKKTRPVTIHKEYDCQCGGDKHPLVAIVRSLFND